MARLLRAVFEPPSGLLVRIDLEALEKVFGPGGDRLGGELAGLVAARCFGGDAAVEEGVAYISVRGVGGGEDYGFLERCVEEVERGFLSDRGVVGHYVLVYPSREPLDPFEYALYRVEGAPSRGVLYRAAGLAAHALRRGGLECVSYGRRVACHSEGVEPAESLGVDTVLGGLGLVLAGRDYAYYGEERGRRIAARFVSFALRDAARLRGYRVEGNGVFEGAPVYERGDLVVRRGVSFMVRVSGEGYVRLFLSPKFRVESLPLLEFSEGLVGARVVCDELDAVGVVRGFEGGFFLVESGGYVFRVKPGSLRRLFGLGELEEMGILGEVAPRIRVGPRGALALARRFVEGLGAFEAAGSRVVFEGEPLPV